MGKLFGSSKLCSQFLLHKHTHQLKRRIHNASVVPLESHNQQRLQRKLHVDEKVEDYVKPAKISDLKQKLIVNAGIVDGRMAEIIVSYMIQVGSEMLTMISENQQALRITHEKIVKGMEKELFERQLQSQYNRGLLPHLNHHCVCGIINEDGKLSVGYSKRFCDAIGIRRLENPPISKLCRTNPLVQSIRDQRDLSTCSEHMAYEYSEKPIITFNLRIRNGVVLCVHRCTNCTQYNVFGNVVTDFLHGEWVLERLTK